MCGACNLVCVSSSLESFQIRRHDVHTVWSHRADLGGVGTSRAMHGPRNNRSSRPAGRPVESRSVKRSRHLEARVSCHTACSCNVHSHTKKVADWQWWHWLARAHAVGSGTQPRRTGTATGPVTSVRMRQNSESGAQRQSADRNSLIEGNNGIGWDPGALRPLRVAADRCGKRFLLGALFG